MSAGSIIGEPELVRLVDAEALESFGELHGEFTPGRRLARLAQAASETPSQTAASRIADRRPSHDVDVRELRLRFAREKRADARRQCVGARHAPATTFISAMRWPSGTARPARLPARHRQRQPGLLGQLAHDAALRDRPSRPRRRSDRACRPGNRSGRRSRYARPITPSRNAPSDERSAAIGEAVAHRLVGKAPVAPGDEAREVGLEIRAAEHAAGDLAAAQQQHAPVPHLAASRRAASQNARRSRRAARRANGHGAARSADRAASAE